MADTRRGMSKADIFLPVIEAMQLLPRTIFQKVRIIGVEVASVLLFFFYRILNICVGVTRRCTLTQIDLL